MIRKEIKDIGISKFSSANKEFKKSNNKSELSFKIYSTGRAYTGKTVGWYALTGVIGSSIASAKLAKEYTEKDAKYVKDVFDKEGSDIEENIKDRTGKEVKLSVSDNKIIVKIIDSDEEE